MTALRIHIYTRAFFDRPVVINAVSDAERRALSRAGAFVRTRARTSIRRRRAASSPGNPPSSHLGHLRSGILFAYNASSRSVFVGPTLLNNVQFGGSINSHTTVPAMLEFGGTTTRLEYRVRSFTRVGSWIKADYRRNESRRALAALRASGRNEVTLNVTERGGTPIFVEYRLFRASLAARPYIGPATRAEAPKFPGLFANSIR